MSERDTFSLGHSLATQAEELRICERLRRRRSFSEAERQAIWSAAYELELKVRALAITVIEQGVRGALS